MTRGCVYGSSAVRETFFNEPLAEMSLLFAHAGVTVTFY